MAKISKKAKSALISSAETFEALLKAAEKGLKNSYSPYSKFPVGAAILTDKGVFYGCNIENSSFGGTVCAERVAILKAKSEGAKKFTDILILTPRPRPVPPCGLCLQTMSEFFAPEAQVYLVSKSGRITELAYQDLLPYIFTGKDLE